MGRLILLIVGILMDVLGISFFFERGFFASNLLGANVLGNMGWDSADERKIQEIAVCGGISLVIGIIVTIKGALKKDTVNVENK